MTRSKTFFETKHDLHRVEALSRVFVAFGVLFLLTGCAGEFSGPPPPSQTEQLCKSWGYAPNDPVCLNTFRRDRP